MLQFVYAVACRVSRFEQSDLPRATDDDGRACRWNGIEAQNRPESSPELDSIPVCLNAVARSPRWDSPMEQSGAAGTRGWCQKPRVQTTPLFWARDTRQPRNSQVGCLSCLLLSGGLGGGMRHWSSGSRLRAKQQSPGKRPRGQELRDSHSWLLARIREA